MKQVKKAALLVDKDKHCGTCKYQDKIHPACNDCYDEGMPLNPTKWEKK